MSIDIQIVFVIVGLALSYLLVRYTQKVAQYTKEVAQCNKKLTEETKYLRKITEISWFTKETAGYLYDKYYEHITKWPSIYPSWITWLDWKFPPEEKDRPKVFKIYCRRIVLEMLYPQIKPVEEKAKIILEKQGFEFSKKD